MTDIEKREIYLSCRQFLNGHYPIHISAQLANLSQVAEPSELSDFYGTGEIIESFESEVASLLGKPASVFMPSGTMAQVIAMRVWCDDRNSTKVGFHSTSHLEKHEHHAYRELHKLDAELLGDSKRALTLADFENSSAEFAAALVELPQRELGGVLPSWSDLKGMTEFCRRKNIAVHLDGARLWESAPYYKKSYAEIYENFDSVYVSFYKGLGGVAGAMLCGPTDFIAKAKVWQRRHGGNLIRLYPYILAAREGLKTRLPKMAAYHEKAKQIALALSCIEGIEVLPALPHINMMQIFFRRTPSELEAAFAKIADKEGIALFYKVQPSSGSDGCMAELSVGDATLDLSIQIIEKLLREALDLSK